MENQQSPQSLFGLSINEEAKQELKTLSVWARILAITAFITYGLNLLEAMIGKQFNQGEYAGPTRVSAIMVAIITLAIGVPLNVYLLKFARSALASLKSSDMNKMEISFSNLRIYFKFLGILMIIVLICLGLVIVFATLGALVGGLAK